MSTRLLNIGFFLIIILGLSSCRSSKDIIIMKEIMANENIPNRETPGSEYLLQPGDVLYISIKSIDSDVNKLFNPETNMESSASTGSMTVQRFATPQGAYLYGYEINEDGNIILPVLGAINVNNINESEALHEIQKVADKYLIGATVKVKLLSFNVTILGEVRSPGIYYNYSNNFSILDALAMANGNNDYANLKNVLVIRKAKDFHQTYRLNLQTKSSWQSEAFYLHPDDYVIVEPAKNKNLSLNSQGFSMFMSTVGILLGIIALKL